MRRFLLRSLPISVPLLLLAIALAVRAWDPIPVQSLRDAVFDQFNRWHPRTYDPNVPVRIVNIDDDTLEKIGQWPWPRLRVAELVYRLREQLGAEVIAFDIVFAESDRTSPQNVVTLWPNLPEFEAIRERVKEMPNHDIELAKIMKGLGGVVTGFSLTNGNLPRKPIQYGNFAFSGPNPRNFMSRYPGAVSNVPVLEEAADGNGNFNMFPGNDGVVRRIPLLLSLKNNDDPANDTLYPALSIEALRVLLGAKTVKIKTVGGSGEFSYGLRDGFVKIQVGDVPGNPAAKIEIPTDKKGQIIVHYTGYRPERFVSASKIFDGTVDRSLIEGHIVLIGTDAAGLRDLRTSPMDKVVAGVEIHAEVIEQIAQEHFLRRPDYAIAVELSYMGIVGLILIVLLPYVGAIWCALLGVGTVVGGGAASWIYYTNFLEMYDPLYPAIAVIAVYLSATTINYVRTEGEKKYVRNAMSQYLSPALVEQLADDPSRLKLGGETKELTFLFCDVRGFTTISETFKSNPHGLTVLINRLLTPLTKVILERGGTIDKYMGDCIMAFWNAPLDLKDHAKKACDSALNMFKALDKLNEERRLEAEAAGEKFLPLNVGAGINTGECVVGNMGSEQRFDYSVLGDPVNLAARLEGQSKNYGVKVVLGGDTVRQVDGEFAILELDLIAVKGKTEAVDIYCLYGDKEVADSPDFQKLKFYNDSMLKAFRSQKWDEAEDLIKACRELSGDEIPEFYDLYDERIAEYRENPPPEDWDGVFVATSK